MVRTKTVPGALRLHLRARLGPPDPGRRRRARVSRRARSSARPRSPRPPTSRLVGAGRTPRRGGRSADPTRGRTPRGRKRAEARRERERAPREGRWTSSTAREPRERSCGLADGPRVRPTAPSRAARVGCGPVCLPRERFSKFSSGSSFVAKPDIVAQSARPAPLRGRAPRRRPRALSTAAPVT